MLKQKYFLTDFFILSAEKQPIKLSWRNIEWLLQQIGVTYPTYHYWRKNCSVCRISVKQELAPISFKQTVTASSPEEEVPHGVAVLFPNDFRVHILTCI